VPAVRLSSLLGRLGTDGFSLVCDVEGAEWGLVEKEISALDRCRQMIIEVHPSPPPRSDDPTELLRQLLESGRFVERNRHGPVIHLERSS
jgi:hypothetical protein